MGLRYYQQEAVDCVKDEFNGLLVLPAGTGKSLVITGIAQKYPNDFILVFQPSKEILEQNYAKILKVIENPDEVGIFSASLNQKNIRRITFATIGSIKDYDEFRKFKIIIIDEAHLVSSQRLSQFSRLIRYINPKIFVGVTATPYRMFIDFIGSMSWKFLHRIQPNIFKDIAYIYQNKQAFDDGYILKPTYHEYDYNTSTLDISGCEYSERSVLRLNKAIDIYGKVVDAVLNSRRNHILIFTTSIQEAEIIADKLRFFGITSSEISSKTKSKDRQRILSDFKSGKIRAVINVGVLTTGFNFPALDCVIGARPTMSLALYIQMVGRGDRICDGKTSWDYHDFCGNIKIFGKMEDYIIEGKGENTSLRNADRYLIKGRSQAIDDLGGDWIVPFGRHRGKNIRNVDMSYLRDCLAKIENFRYKKQFQLEIMRRNDL